MGTLEFGLKHADHEVGRESLGALGAMGAFHHAATAEAAEAAANPRVGNLASLAGPVGLGAHNAPSPERGGVGILAHLMRVVLNRLIFEDASMELSEAAADALLPLMTCERDAFRRTAEELLAGLSGNAGAQQHVAAALHELTTGNGLTNKVDRANGRRFPEEHGRVSHRHELRATRVTRLTITRAKVGGRERSARVRARTRGWVECKSREMCYSKSRARGGSGRPRRSRPARRLLLLSKKIRRRNHPQNHRGSGALRDSAPPRLFRRITIACQERAPGERERGTGRVSVRWEGGAGTMVEKKAPSEKRSAYPVGGPKP